MATPFPFDLPGPTAWYVVLMVGTWAVHAFLASYVLAGGIYLAWKTLTGSSGACGPLGVADPVFACVADWGPAVLGAAITAGVAPLLFIQILYQTEFYTANLLLSHSWMVMLPVLITAFYGLYVLKSGAGERTVWLRIVAIVVLVALLFVAASWARNHLLSLRRDEWVAVYVGRASTVIWGQFLPRLGVWVFGAIPVWASMVAWQTRGRGGDGAGMEVRGRLGTWSLVGLAGAVACMLIYAWGLAPERRGSLVEARSVLWFAFVLLGGVLQGWAWIGARRRRSRRGFVGMVVAGAAMIVLGMSGLREIVRLVLMSETLRPADHLAASNVAGLPVFLAFLLFSGACIAFVVILVRRHVRRGDALVGTRSVVPVDMDG